MAEPITFPRTDFPTDDARAWLFDVERAMLSALLCDDLSVSVNIAVKLSEYRGTRTPKKLTPEQEARESAASRHMGAYTRALGSPRTLLFALAAERQETSRLRALIAWKEENDRG